jgi:hypothetical protein
VKNTNVETKYEISQEDGNECNISKEDLSTTCKSHASKLPHHQFVIAESCF